LCKCLAIDWRVVKGMQRSRSSVANVSPSEGACFHIPSRYRFLKALGSGSYGTVSAFHDLERNRDVAVKRVKGVFANFLVLRRTLREVKLMRHFRHPNLLRLHKVLSLEDSGKDLYLSIELMDCDLDKVIHGGRSLSDYQARCFTAQMLLGLLHLHSGHVIHRDLKPANIFVRLEKGHVKIGDLGLSRGIAVDEETGEATHPCGEMLTEYVVTRWYRAPEVLLARSKYGPAVDVWSVGCILYEMWAKKALFPGKNSYDQLRRIVTTTGVPPTEDLLWVPRSSRPLLDKACAGVTSAAGLAALPVSTGRPEGGDLLQSMCCLNPLRRISVEGALQHPYLAGLTDERDARLAKDVAPADVDYDKLFDGVGREGEAAALSQLGTLLRFEVSGASGALVQQKGIPLKTQSAEKSGNSEDGTGPRRSSRTSEHITCPSHASHRSLGACLAGEVRRVESGILRSRSGGAATGAADAAMAVNRHRRSSESMGQEPLSVASASRTSYGDCSNDAPAPWLIEGLRDAAAELQRLSRPEVARAEAERTSNTNSQALRHHASVSALDIPCSRTAVPLSSRQSSSLADTFLLGPSLATTPRAVPHAQISRSASAGKLGKSNLTRRSGYPDNEGRFTERLRDQRTSGVSAKSLHQHDRSMDDIADTFREEQQFGARRVSSSADAEVNVQRGGSSCSGSGARACVDVARRDVPAPDVSQSSLLRDLPSARTAVQGEAPRGTTPPHLHVKTSSADAAVALASAIASSARPLRRDNAHRIEFANSEVGSLRSHRLSARSLQTDSTSEDQLAEASLRVRRGDSQYELHMDELDAAVVELLGVRKSHTSASHVSGSRGGGSYVDEDVGSTTLPSWTSASTAASTPSSCPAPTMAASKRMTLPTAPWEEQPPQPPAFASASLEPTRRLLRAPTAVVTEAPTPPWSAERRRPHKSEENAAEPSPQPSHQHYGRRGSVRDLMDAERHWKDLESSFNAAAAPEQQRCTAAASSAARVRHAERRASASLTAAVGRVPLTCRRSSVSTARERDAQLIYTGREFMF